jgi:hypothetical protein
MVRHRPKERFIDYPKEGGSTILVACIRSVQPDMILPIRAFVQNPRSARARIDGYIVAGRCILQVDGRMRSRHTTGIGASGKRQ